MKTAAPLFFTVLLLASQIFAIAPKNKSNNKQGGNNPQPVAGCTPPSALTYLELNNVKCRIETGGLMWQDRPNSIADYQVPKPKNPGDLRYTAIYSGSIWMGGIDVNGQLKLAAMMYGQGFDFYTGPLNTTTAEIDAQTCSEWDKFFHVKKSDVALHRAYFDCQNTSGCDMTQFAGYTIPQYFFEWPAHGDASKGQAPYLAPFYDYDGDGYYDPTAGDYPYYDINGEIDCRQVRDPRLFGDETYWWIFNDKGNAHTESQGPSIGMEVHAQAFAFATNDEVNDMTFYNYELINRSSFTLTNTYFGQFVDPDLGNYDDDYIGCDVSRGLGYCYNGDANDQNNGSAIGYGANPPAIGIDFFEGPYMDNDGIDNPLTTDVAVALAQNGIPYEGLGLGYGDGIIDNERYGMRKFMYFSRAGVPNYMQDPQVALDYYRYMTGKWKDGSSLVYGGDGHVNGGGTIPTDYAFPNSSDPLNWATHGVAAGQPWSEYSVGNLPGDRRLFQSAGPFTLEPGAVNDLTVGVVYARATNGVPFESVKKLLIADDKAQALFDNCFKVLDGPDAPNLTAQELNNEIILYIDNPLSSNNYKEQYWEKDPFTGLPDTLDGVPLTKDQKDSLSAYQFEGYQIYQLKDATVSVNELYDIDKARLVAQCDLQNGVKRLINYTFDEDLQANVPQEMVDGEDKGIRHSFRVTKDLFATGVDKLVNHKTYYYIAVAYGYNNYKTYDPLDPSALDGQKKPYISSRKTATGGGIIPITVIPHNPAPENGGTYQQAEYGDSPEITRLEGIGNMGMELRFTEASEQAILSSNFKATPTYQKGYGPIDVKVIDPLNVKGGDFTIKLLDTANAGNLNNAVWELTTPDGKVINSDKSIALENEQILPEYGISVTIKQSINPFEDENNGNGAIGASIEFSDSTKQWLTGVADIDGQTDQNWIRSGTFSDPNNSLYNDYNGDDNEDFEKLLGGTWAPHYLVSYPSSNSSGSINDAPGAAGTGYRLIADMKKYLHSVDIVITSDKSKWTRCPVLEAQTDNTLSEGNADHLSLRAAPSVDKNGNPDGTGNGMGWFPGYAIDLETGKRLNMAFAENSWLAGENGRDMKWNPTSTLYDGVFNSETRWGGEHYIYVFGETQMSGVLTSMPAYDQGQTLANLIQSGTISDLRSAWRSCMWVGIPLVEEGEDFMSTDVRIRLRVSRRYESFATGHVGNNDNPMYGFDLTDLATLTNDEMAIDSALAMINVVPNPYYSTSEYEVGQLDTRVKITNLPEECTIQIYNINGTLVRSYNKADSKTSLDWDLKNHAGIPIAGGVYLIHVTVPDVGERTLKWFGVMRPTDLNGF